MHVIECVVLTFTGCCAIIALKGFNTHSKTLITTTTAQVVPPACRLISFLKGKSFDGRINSPPEYVVSGGFILKDQKAVRPRFVVKREGHSHHVIKVNPLPVMGE